MNPFRLAVNELRRLTASRLPRLALVAMVLIPTLYGGLYLYANHDPYARFPELPAAIVSEDTGTTLSTGEKLQVGDSVAEEVVSSATFDWHRVDKAEALAGVDDGTYAFALILPADFSADLASTAAYQPRQASILLETNDANNYMTTTIANQVVRQVTSSVASQVSETAASKMLLGFSTVHDKMQQAVDGAGRLADGAAKADTGAGRLATGADQLSTGVSDLASGARQLDAGVTRAKGGAEQLATGAGALASGLDTLESAVTPLPAQADKLADGAAQVADGNAQVATKATQVADASTTLRTGLGDVNTRFLAELRAAGVPADQVDLVAGHLADVDARVAAADAKVQTAASDLKSLSVGATQVAQGARTLADGMPTLVTSVSQAADGAHKVSDGAGSLATGLGELGKGSGALVAGADKAVTGASSVSDGSHQLASGVHELATGSAQLRDQLAAGVEQVPDPSDAQRKAMAETIGHPVTVDSASFASAGTYGAGLAPMFMSLGLWIGAYTLFLLVRPLSNRALATSQWSLRTALGGWLAPTVLGVAQVAALVAVITLALDIHVAHPVGAFAFLLLVSASFMALLHGLSSLLGAVGKYLGLVFMVVQLVSAGGTFPWQTLPGPLQAVHHVVPMSYAIDGLRRLMYGAELGPVLGDSLVLVAYLAGGLVLSTIAARRGRTWTAARLKPALSL